MSTNLLNQFYSLLWTFVLPFSIVFLTIWALWWPRRSIPYSRILAMAVFITCWWLLYAAVGEDVFNWIQRL